MILTLDAAVAKLSAAKAFVEDGSMTNADKRSMINEALESILLSNRFIGSHGVLNTFVMSTTGIYSLPRQFLTVIAAKVNQSVRKMASQMYPFLPGTTDLSQFSTNIQDIGDGSPVFKQPNTPAQLRIQCTGESSTVEIHGLDGAGNEIWSPPDTSTHGEIITFNAAKAGAYFGTITRVVKPVTADQAFLFACYPDGTEEVIAVYEPGETMPDYRQYLFQEAILNRPQTSPSPVGLTTATPFSIGSGYSVNDILTVVGGTFSIAAQIKVEGVNGSGGITAVQIYLPGSYPAPPTSPVSVAGGTGTNATFNMSFVSGASTFTGVDPNPIATPISLYVRRRHVDMVADNDVLPITNLRALKNGVLHIYWENQGDETRSQKHLDDAIEWANKEIKLYHPPFEEGAVRVNASLTAATGLKSFR
jgi:hypothetical protein